MANQQLEQTEYGMGYDEIVQFDETADFVPFSLEDAGRVIGRLSLPAAMNPPELGPEEFWG